MSTAAFVVAATLAYCFVAAALRRLTAYFDLHRQRHDLVAAAKQARIDYYEHLHARRGEISGTSGNNASQGVNVDIEDDEPAVVGTIEPTRQAA